VLAGLSDAVAGEEAGRPTIIVELFDHAGLSAETLTQAKNDVSRIYGDVGVEVLWTDVAVKDAHGRFVIHLIIRPKAARPRVMGNAFSESRGTGGTAFVYRDRVLDVARARDVDVARVLAYAMAHEMGHLLLPYPSHAAAGIMHADWDGDELRDMAAGSLRFTPAQANAIRAKASASGAVTTHAGSEDARLSR
jgi:hypothetical protein